MLPSSADTPVPAASAVPAGGNLPGGPARPRPSVLPVALILLATVVGTLVLLALLASPFAGAAGGCGGG